MKVKQFEIYNEETQKLEIVDIYGFCEYCRNCILATEKYKKKKSGLYHDDCWIQKHL